MSGSLIGAESSEMSSRGEMQGETPPSKVMIEDIRHYIKALYDYFWLLSNTVGNKYGLTQEQSDDTWTQANAEVQNALKADIPVWIFREIREANYDISGFGSLIEDNLIITTAEWFRVSGYEIIDQIEYKKNKRAQAQDLKENYDAIGNMMGFETTY